VSIALVFSFERRFQLGANAYKRGNATFNRRRRRRWWWRWKKRRR
jgi:hypothetical protein